MHPQDPHDCCPRQTYCIENNDGNQTHENYITTEMQRWYKIVLPRALQPRVSWTTYKRLSNRSKHIVAERCLEPNECYQCILIRSTNIRTFCKQPQRFTLGKHTLYKNQSIFKYSKILFHPTYVGILF